MKKIIKVLGFFTAASQLFLLFGLFNFAQAAACNYLVTLEAKPATARVDETVTLTTTAQRVTSGGVLSNCASSADFTFQYKKKNGTTQTLGSRTANFSGSSATANYPVNLKDSYSSMKSNLANPNVIPFSVYYQMRGPELATGRTSDVMVNVSGSTTSSGNISVKFVPFKSTYNQGDKFAVEVSGRSFSLDSSITSMFLAVKVNGQENQNIVTQVTNITRAQFFNGFTTPQITVNSTNKFQDGVNTVRIELWQSGTSLKIAESTVNIQADVAGSTSTPAPGPGSSPAPSPSPSPSDSSKPDTSLKEVLFNPLPVDSLTGVLLYITRGFLAIVALWGVTFIIIGGFKLVMAQGNEEAYLAAKKTITWAILGVVVAMLSFSIIAIVQNLIGARVPEPPAGENPIIENKPKPK